MKYLHNLLTLSVLTFFCSSCATIVGGSKYKANVIVVGHPKASISYNGFQQGFGNAQLLIPRNKSSNLSFTISEEGCQDQTFSYSSRVVRGWALLGSLVFWTGTLPLPIPYGGILDFATGSVYKPDVKELGVSKNNHDSFNYTLNYNGCSSESTQAIESDSSYRTKEERLIALKALYQDGLITKEEYEREKKKILAEI